MRAGLNGARSGLFMEQIRIIQEMRDADRKSGRTGVHIRPRFGVWENVVGALSSGRDAETGQKKPGADFQKVLEAFLQVEEPYLHVVRPETGRWEYAGGILGVRSSMAWIVWDSKLCSAEHNLLSQTIQAMEDRTPNMPPAYSQRPVSGLTT